MKRLLLCLPILLIAGLSWAQPVNNRLRGFVKLLNSGSQPLAGVQISSFGSSPTASKSDGSFELVFANKQPGDKVALLISKNGYDLVNSKEVEDVIIRKNADDLITIVMCPQGQRNQIALNYYNIIIQNANAALEKKLAAIDARLGDLESDDQARNQLLEEKERLRQERDQAVAQAEDLARRLADIDLDQASELSREALETLQSGDLDAALAVLDEEKLDRQLATLDAKEKQKEEELANIRSAREKAIGNFLLKARLLAASFQFEEAERSFQKAIAADSTDMDNIGELVLFYQRTYRYNAAVKLLEGSIDLTEGKQKVALYDRLASLYHNLKEIDRAQECYEKGLEQARQLDAEGDEEGLVALAGSIGNYCYFAQSVGKTELAEKLNEEAIGIIERLVQEDPEKMDIQSVFFINLSVYYFSVGRMEEGEQILNQALEALRAGTERKPETYRPFLGFLLNLAASYYYSQQDYAHAAELYEEARTIAVELEKQGIVSAPSVIYTFHNLGVYHRQRSELQEAKRYLYRAVVMQRAFEEKFPNAPTIMRDQVLFELGDIHTHERQFDSAAYYYALVLEGREGPGGSGYVQSQSALKLAVGRMCAGLLPEAAEYLDLALQISKDLVEQMTVSGKDQELDLGEYYFWGQGDAFEEEESDLSLGSINLREDYDLPEIYQQISSIYRNRATYFTTIGQMDEAETSLNLALEYLQKAGGESQEFMAQTYAALGYLAFRREKLEEAFDYYRREYELNKEFYRNYPEEADSTLSGPVTQGQLESGCTIFTDSLSQAEIDLKEFSLPSDQTYSTRTFLQTELVKNCMHLLEFASNANDSTAAKELFVELFSLLDDLERRAPATRAFRVRANYEYALFALQGLGNRDLAVEHWRQTVRVAEQLAAEQDSLPFIADYFWSAALNDLGFALQQLGKVEEADSMLLQALQIRKEMARNWPSTVEADVCKTLLNLAELEWQKDGTDAVAPRIEELVQLFEPIRTRIDANGSGLLSFAICRLLAKYYLQTDALDRSDRWQDLAETYPPYFLPENPSMAGEWASYLYELGLTAFNIKRWDRATRYFQECLQTAQEWEDHPGMDREYLKFLQAAALNDLGVVEIEREELNISQAQKYLEQARDLRKELVASDPSLMSDLEQTLENLLLLTQEQKYLEDYYQTVLDFATEWDDPQRWEKAMLLHVDLLVFYLRNGYTELADQLNRDAFARFDRLQIGSPGAVALLAEKYFGTGQLYLHQAGMPEKARPFYERSVELYTGLAEGGWGTYQDFLASCFNDLGIIYRESGELEQALVWYQKSLQIRRQLAVGDQLGYKADVAQSAVNAGIVQEALQRFDEAFQSFEEVLGYYQILQEAGIDGYDKALLDVHYSMANNRKLAIEQEGPTKDRKEQGLASLNRGLEWLEKMELDPTYREQYQQALEELQRFFAALD